MYPKWQILATGGAIGDCLFLFCSGFTLFTRPPVSFGEYYKRRINRIYPSVFASAVFIQIITRNAEINYMTLLGGEFIIAIMIYYVLLYFVNKYAVDKVPGLLLLLSVVSLAVYILWFPYKYETGINGIYGITTYYRWIPYFAAMLMGAYVGRKRPEMKFHGWRDFALLLIGILAFYSIQFASRLYPSVAPFQVITLLPLMGITYYLYKLCNVNWIVQLYKKKVGNAVIMFVGGLCLESYLIQNVLFTDRMNGIWPLNLIIIVCVILICSYVVRCFARLFSQTFRNVGDYEWKQIFSLY